MTLTAIEMASRASAKSANFVTLLLHGLQILEQFLPLQRVAVRSLADHLQLILNPLQRCVLLGNLVAQVTMLGLQRGKAVFQWFQIHRWQLRLGLGVRSQNIRDRRPDISIEQRRKLVHKRQRRTNRICKPLQTLRTIAGREARGWSGRVLAGVEPAPSCGGSKHSEAPTARSGLGFRQATASQQHVAADRQKSQSFVPGHSALLIVDHLNRSCLPSHPL